MPDGPLEIPLREWRLRNFKSIESATIQFCPLTVLVGPNSSGKTSLVQSILLFVQAARSWMNEARLPLNGVYLGLGEFDNVLRSRSDPPEMSFGGTFRVTDRPRWALAARHAARRSYPGRAAFLRETEESGATISWDVDLRSEAAARQRGSASISRLQLSLADGEAVLDARLAEGTPVAASHSRIARYAGRLQVGDAIRSDLAGLRHQAGIPTELAVERATSELEVERWLGVLARALSERDLGPEAGSWRTRSRATRWAQLLLDQELFGGPQLVLEMPSEDTAGYPRSSNAEGPAGSVHHLARAANLPVDLVDRLLLDFRRFLEEDPAKRGTHTLRGGALADLSEREARLLEDLSRDTDRIGPVLQALLRISEDQRSGPPTRLVPMSGPISARFLTAAEVLLGFLRQGVSYLGPLREKPELMYRVSQTEASEDIGVSGQFTAAVLYRHGPQYVFAPRPSGHAGRLTLNSAINEWLREFGLAASLATEDRGRLGIELQVQVPDLALPLDITSVGVGLSQVLPVLVRVLLAEPGSLVMLEQPELHLHPALQQKLGDFLLQAARSGRQILVETHSDHLVNRLRRRIAEDLSDETRDTVRLLNMWREGGSTRCEPVPVNAYGGIDDWPPGFFDQGPDEVREIVRRGLEKKRLHRGESGPEASPGGTRT